MRRLALHLEKRRLAWPTIVLALGVGCSSATANRPRPKADDEVEPGDNKITFRNPELAARYKAAKASPQSFEPVFAYVKPVADTCLASLVDKSCEECAEGAIKYRRRSELDAQLWPILEDALSMLEALGNLPGLPAEQMEQLVATKGRLLWLAGRSMEEQSLIDGYALAHPTAGPVIRRRLELLREAGDATAIVAQCARSRAKMGGAPEATRVDLLTACVAFHPDNAHGRSDLTDYAQYLPDLSEAEDDLYRTSLVRRCVEKVGDESVRCAKACACEDKDGGKPPTAKCKRSCQGCRSETAQKQQVCKKLGEITPAPVAAPPRRPKGTSGPRPTPAKSAPAKSAPARHPKGGSPGLEPEQAVL